MVIDRDGERSCVLGIGLVGCGVIANAHLNAYSLIPQVKVFAVCDVVESSARKTARAFGVDTVYLNYDELLKDERIDVVDICVPAQLHKEFTIRALEAGKHVFCEKPIAASLAEADEVIEAQRRLNRNVFIGQSGRYLPLVLKARRLISEGSLGRVLAVRVAHRFDNPFEKWALNPEQGKYYWEKGGGPIIDSGVHGADLCNWLIGGAPISVMAHGVRHPRVLPFFTSAHIHIEYEDSSHGLVIVNRQTRRYPQYERYLEILGTERRLWGFDNYYRQTIIPNSLSLASIIETTSLTKTPPTAHKQFIEHIPANSEIYSELKDFVNALLNGDEPPISLLEARRALEICIAAELSARKNREIELPVAV